MGLAVLRFAVVFFILLISLGTGPSRVSAEEVSEADRHQGQQLQYSGIKLHQRPSNCSSE